MPNDFDRVFAENESQPFQLTDLQYRGGWESIVNQEPPKKQQFNAIHKELDSKAREAYFRSRSVYQPDFTYEINDLVFGVDGVLYKANVSVIGVPPTSTATQWDATAIGGTGGSSGSGVPAGTIIASAAGIAPAGFLICNGAVAGQTTYPDLFAAIGGGFNDTFPATPGSVPAGAFRIPYLLDVYAVGSGSPPGIFLPQSAGHHTHRLPRLSAVNLPNAFGFNTSNSGGGFAHDPNSFTQAGNDFGTTTSLTDIPSVSTGSIIRPASVTVRNYIKT